MTVSELKKICEDVEKHYGGDTKICIRLINKEGTLLREENLKGCSMNGNIMCLNSNDFTIQPRPKPKFNITGNRIRRYNYDETI